jgi:hypothetical protein
MLQEIETGIIRSHSVKKKTRFGSGYGPIVKHHDMIAPLPQKKTGKSPRSGSWDKQRPNITSALKGEGFNCKSLARDTAYVGTVMNLRLHTRRVQNDSTTSGLVNTARRILQKTPTENRAYSTLTWQQTSAKRNTFGTFVLSFALDFRNYYSQEKHLRSTVALRHEDVGLYTTSSIAQNILWYQLINLINLLLQTRVHGMQYYNCSNVTFVQPKKVKG